MIHKKKHNIALPPKEEEEKPSIIRFTMEDLRTGERKEYEYYGTMSSLEKEIAHEGFIYAGYGYIGQLNSIPYYLLISPLMF